MKKIYAATVVGIVAYVLFPAVSFAATAKTVTGVITQINVSSVVVSTGSAAKYSIDGGNAQLLRKNGASMQFSEFRVGDKVEAKGNLWSDNSMNALYIKDLSLYAHTGTFSGKITAIDPAAASYTIDGKTNGTQTIYTNSFTAFTKNGATASFSSLELGMTLSVKGVWDRSKANVVATKVEGSFRMINIYFTGISSMKNGNALTVIGNGNVIYGVDASNSLVQNKNGQPIPLSRYQVGQAVRVWGKHISGMMQVTATQIKNIAITN